MMTFQKVISQFPAFKFCQGPLGNCQLTAVYYFSLALPKAFQSSIHGLITASNMVEGVRGTMRAGGCNASRSTFIAACFGAMV